MKAIFIFLFAALLWWTFGGTSDAYLYSERHEVVTVQVGDDIWSIAKNYVDDREDIRALIAAIHKINGLEQASSIYPGQKIRIPLRNAGF